MDVPPTVLPKNRPLPSVEDLKSDEQKNTSFFLEKSLIVRPLTCLVRKLKESVALKDNFGCKKGQ